MPLAFRRTPQRHVRSASRAQLLHALTSGSCHCPAASPARPSLPLDQLDHPEARRHLRRPSQPELPARPRFNYGGHRPRHVAPTPTALDAWLASEPNRTPHHHCRPPPSSPNPAVHQRPRHRPRLPLMAAAAVRYGRRRPGHLEPLRANQHAPALLRPATVPYLPPTDHASYPKRHQWRGPPWPFSVHRGTDLLAL